MHLDHLDIRRCYNVDMDAALRAKCARIKALKLPRDCTDGDESFRIGDTQLSGGRLRLAAAGPAEAEARDWADMPRDALMAVLYRLGSVESLGGAARAWARGLPRDAMQAVLRRLGQAEILGAAGQVCRSWRPAVADEAELWRRGGEEEGRPPARLSVARVAAGLGSGRRREPFVADRIGCDGFLLYLGKRLPYIRSLCLTSCYIVCSEGFVEAIKGFPHLEKLELSLCTNIFGEAIVAAAEACPHLKRFRLSKARFYCFDDDHSNDQEALAISTMRELRSLQLFGNNLSNRGISAILDNCPDLESLDIRHCFNIKMEASLQAKCARIRTLRLPDDLLDDYEFQVKSPIRYKSIFQSYLWSDGDEYLDRDYMDEDMDNYERFIPEDEDLIEATRKEEPLDFLSQLHTHHPAAAIDASDYGFSQASSGHAGSGVSFYFLGSGSRGLDIFFTPLPEQARDHWQILSTHIQSALPNGDPDQWNYVWNPNLYKSKKILNTRDLLQRKHFNIQGESFVAFAICQPQKITFICSSHVLLLNNVGTVLELDVGISGIEEMIIYSIMCPSTYARMLHILGKLSAVQLLLGSAAARRAARDEPSLWRSVVVNGYSRSRLPPRCRLSFEEVARAAVLGSQGRCEAFRGRFVGGDDFILFLADSAPFLKSLRLILCHKITSVAFAAAIMKFPLLEELEVSRCRRIEHICMPELVANLCPQIKHFRHTRSRDRYCVYNINRPGNDSQALAIASMRQLRSLQLFRDDMTNEGLMTILDKCPYLESIDIRSCRNLTMDGTLRARCAMIKTKTLYPCKPADEDEDFQPGSPISYCSTCAGNTDMDIGSESDFDDISGRGRGRRRCRRNVEARNWADLALDAILTIFHKLDHIDILMAADQVCASWRRAARDEPTLWPRITMRGTEALSARINRGGLACAAVCRSAGRCEAFCGEFAGDDGFLMYLAEQASCLKSLRLISCLGVSNEGIEEAIKQFPLLEELELSFCDNVTYKAYAVIGVTCGPQLKCLRLIKSFFDGWDGNQDVMWIKNMHELRSLQLFANTLTNKRSISYLG
uniref:F-box domain-containing protein n=1 Tax=Oryza rufipogon TaxID=4529 RepID=A0A0E0QFF0_ORYRU